jgi:hypothetical protein
MPHNAIESKRRSLTAACSRHPRRASRADQRLAGDGVQRRISYHVVSYRSMEVVAPIVARLAGG